MDLKLNISIIIEFLWKKTKILPISTLYTLFLLISHNPAIIEAPPATE